MFFFSLWKSSFHFRFFFVVVICSASELSSFHFFYTFYLVFCHSLCLLRWISKSFFGFFSLTLFSPSNDLNIVNLISGVLMQSINPSTTNTLFDYLVAFFYVYWLSSFDIVEKRFELVYSLRFYLVLFTYNADCVQRLSLLRSVLVLHYIGKSIWFKNLNISTY